MAILMEDSMVGFPAVQTPFQWTTDSVCWLMLNIAFVLTIYTAICSLVKTFMDISFFAKQAEEERSLLPNLTRKAPASISGGYKGFSFEIS